MPQILRTATDKNRRAVTTEAEVTHGITSLGLHRVSTNAGNSALVLDAQLPGDDAAQVADAETVRLLGS
jgi:hypothetical protein